MNTSTLTRPTATKGSGGCGCAGAGCAACQAQGAARPCFFAGQLLTEDDLQALSDYVLEKNRLHNRHFMGDGVVCGLQVGCNPCGGGKLVVQPGHALDCCGNDLLLECALELDANAMVRDLRRSLLGGYDCGDPCADAKPATGKGDDQARPARDSRHYALYIRYTEQASDPVAPYATGEACGSSACQATRVREGVRFELRCCSEGEPPDGFLARALRCLHDLTQAEVLAAALARLFQAGATPQDVAAAREAMLDQVDAAAPLADCSLRAAVAAIPLPAQGGDVAPARDKLVQAYLRLIGDCLCAALLPPCPPCDDPAVLLASFELADCAVVNICNLERKLVLSAPNFRYWFPVNLFGDLLERLCCPADPCAQEPAPAPTPTPTPAPTATATATATATPTPTPGVSGLTPTYGQPQGLAKPTQAMSKTSMAADAATLRTLLTDQLLRNFKLTGRDASRLGRIGENLGQVFAAGAFDDVLPARMLRRVAGAGVGATVRRELLDSPAIRQLAAELSQQHTSNLEAARREFQLENAKTSEAMAAQNQELRSQLLTVQDRLKKLEAAPPPATPTPAPTPAADDTRKPPKK